MNTEQRKEMVLLYEGQALHAAGRSNISYGADNARCAIDGTFNALIRIEGADAAAEYAFALADRVVGRIRAPTQWPIPPKEPVVIAAAPVAIEPPKAVTPKPMRFWAIFAIGWVCGLVMGSSGRA